MFEIASAQAGSATIARNKGSVLMQENKYYIAGIEARSQLAVYTLVWRYIHLHFPKWPLFGKFYGLSFVWQNCPGFYTFHSWGCKLQINYFFLTITHKCLYGMCIIWDIEFLRFLSSEFINVYIRTYL
jgi:hypothetical protein